LLYTKDMLKYDQWEQISDKKLKKGFWGISYLMSLTFGTAFGIAVSDLTGHLLDPYIIIALLVAGSFLYLIGIKLSKKVTYGKLP